MGNIFNEDFTSAQIFKEGEVSFRFLNIKSLIQAKRSSGRHRDLDDIEQLGKKWA